MNTNVSTETKLSKSAQKRLKAQEHNANYKFVPDVKLTKEQKEELEALSHKAYGVTSKGLTMLRNGQVVDHTETVTEYIPGEDGRDGTTREVQVPVKYQNSNKSLVKNVKRHTFDSVKTHLNQVIEMNEKLRAMLAKMKADQEAEQARKLAEAKAEEEKKNTLQNLQGSAI